MAKKLCRVCKKRPAALPDRKREGTPRKEICRECHAERLCGDMVYILEVERKRRTDEDQG